MLNKPNLVVIFAISIALLTLAAEAQATKRSAKFKHADRNKDGSVDQHEKKLEKNWEQAQRSKADINNDGLVSAKKRELQWKHTNTAVNTPLEKKYDYNNDGLLQPEEAKDFLRARCALIKTNGKAIVNSNLEKEYDVDNNGIIDAPEAKAMLEDATD